METNSHRAWQQLTARDKSATFFYGVRSTGIFCRVGCPSRLPLRQNTLFFSGAAEALAAGFRPCQRCHPDRPSPETTRIHRLVEHLQNHLDRAVPLAELGRLAHCSPFTVQRAFKRMLGLTPAQYQRQLRASGLRQSLKESNMPEAPQNVTEAIYAAGYGSASRVYESKPLGMNPSRFRAGAAGEILRYATAPCMLGHMLVAETDRGICAVLLGENTASMVEDLRSQFPSAELIPDNSLAPHLEAIAQAATGSSQEAALPLDLQGTAFQMRVWQTLQKIPLGETRSYTEIAAALKTPKAVRAVASACARNKVALLVPCHRVIGSNGKLTGYRWGLERKKKLLAAEQAGKAAL